MADILLWSIKNSQVIFKCLCKGVCDEEIDNYLTNELPISLPFFQTSANKRNKFVFEAY